MLLTKILLWFFFGLKTKFSYILWGIFFWTINFDRFKKSWGAITNSK
jgi:hypothetical protein